MEVGDDAVLHRAHREDAFGRAAQHPLGLEPDAEDVASGLIHGGHRRLVQHDAFALDEDQGVGGAQVHCELAGGTPGLPLGELPTTGHGIAEEGFGRGRRVDVDGYSHGAVSLLLGCLGPVMA